VVLAAALAVACGASTRTEASQTTHGTGGSAGESGAAGTAVGASGGQGGAAGRASSTGGTGGAGTAGAAGSVDPDAPTIAGAWAMFDFEDPVTVYLQRDGNELSGMGSCVPVTTSVIVDCQGKLSGTIDGHHAAFSFPASFLTYGADVIASEDWQRMAGNFVADGSTGGSLWIAWARIPDGQSWLTSTDQGLIDAVDAREGTFAIQLVSGTGDAFGSAGTYSLLLRNGHGVPTLSGNLGAFWGGEMKWDEAAETLDIGPVPVTRPELPIEVHAQFDGTALLTVEATMPGDDVYEFDGIPP
jgi:hypothetical protein